HILAHAAQRRLGQAVLSKSASEREQRAKERRQRCTVLVGGRKNGVLKGLRHKPNRDRVLEDEGSVEQLVRGSAHRDANHGLAGLAGPHDGLLDHRLPALKNRRRGRFMTFPARALWFCIMTARYLTAPCAYNAIIR